MLMVILIGGGIPISNVLSAMADRRRSPTAQAASKCGGRRERALRAGERTMTDQRRLERPSMVEETASTFIVRTSSWWCRWSTSTTSRDAAA
jgi:hypothetical protein